MVAPWAALLAGAFVSGQAVFHGRELLAELPLVSELPFFSRGTRSGARGGPGLRLLSGLPSWLLLGVWVSLPREAGGPKPNALVRRNLGDCGGGRDELEGWIRGPISKEE